MRFASIIFFLLASLASEFALTAPKQIGKPPAGTNICISSMREIALPPKTYNGEMTEMRGQFSQGGGLAPEVPKDNLVSTFHLHGVPGDPVFPEANGDYTNIVFSSATRQEQGLAAAPRPGVKPLAQLSQGEKLLLVENYIRINNADLPLSEDNLKKMVKAAQAVPSATQDAFAAYERGNLTLERPRQLTAESRLMLHSNTTSSREVTTGSRSTALEVAKAAPVENKLSSAGEDRYFRFTPSGSSQEVAARVLDIHVKPDGKVHVYAEWMKSSANGERTREVGIISVDELKTMTKLSKADRVNAALDFFDSLTPNQVSAQMLARKLGLEPRGYTDFMRSPGMKNQNPELITEKMSNLAHHSARVEAQKKFGNFDDLLTEAEKKNENWNVMDVFGRLSPEYVLKRFRAKDGYKYMYVITEDGQLKVCPLGPETTNMRPQLLRLGHGRKVYSTGTFSLDENGAVNLTRRNADYTSFDGAVAQGAHESPNENNFLEAVFRMQAATETSSINSAPPATWNEIRFNERTGLYENVNDATAGASSTASAKPRSSGTAAGGPSPFGDYDSKEAHDFVESILRQRRSEKPIVADWPRENSGATPPSFEEWSKLANANPSVSMRGESESKLDYAHFVLGTNGNQTFKEIRETYRKLISKFYTKDGTQDARAAQRINDAFKMFKDKERR